MKSSTLSFDPVISRLKLLFLNSQLQCEHAVGAFLKTCEQLRNQGELSLADYTLLINGVTDSLTQQNHTVQGLQALDKWQRNAFAMQLAQTLLHKVDYHQLYECEEAALALRSSLGIGNTARAMLDAGTRREARASATAPTRSAPVINFAEKVENSSRKPAASPRAR